MIDQGTHSEDGSRRTYVDVCRLSLLASEHSTDTLEGGEGMLAEALNRRWKVAKSFTESFTRDWEELHREPGGEPESTKR